MDSVCNIVSCHDIPCMDDEKKSLSVVIRCVIGVCRFYFKSYFLMDSYCMMWLSIGGYSMRKTTGIALSLTGVFCFAGCSNKTIHYNPNLGFDVSGMDHKNVEFNVYHSKTNDHTWELLKKFSCSPKEGYCADVRVEGENGRVVITSEDNHLVKTHVSESYYCDDLEVYELIVDGFNGQISSAKTFEVKDTDKEQPYLLYPITNTGSGFIFTDLGNKPYDENEENLDNILITIKFN